jgi:hypothetical protein
MGNSSYFFATLRLGEREKEPPVPAHRLTRLYQQKRVLSPKWCRLKTPQKTLDAARQPKDIVVS